MLKCKHINDSNDKYKIFKKGDYLYFTDTYKLEKIKNTGLRENIIPYGNWILTSRDIYNI